VEIIGCGFYKSFVAKRGIIYQYDADMATGDILLRAKGHHGVVLGQACIAQPPPARGKCFIHVVMCCGDVRNERRGGTVTTLFKATIHEKPIAFL